MKMLTKYVAVVTTMASCGSCGALQCPSPSLCLFFHRHGNKLHRLTKMRSCSPLQRFSSKETEALLTKYLLKRAVHVNYTNCHGSTKSFSFLFFNAWYWWHVFSFQPSSAVAHCNPHTSIYKLNCNSARPKMHCHNARLWMQMHTCADHV